MALQVQELNLELEKLRDELQLFNLVKDSNGSDDQSQLINTQRLVQRVSELEDLV